MISMARGGRQRTVGVDDVAQGDAVDVLHDDVGQWAGGRLGLAGVVHRDDGRVVQRSGVLRLAPEAQVEARVAGQVGAQHLDRDVAVQADVAGQMDLGHAAEAEDLAQFVAVGQVLRGGHRGVSCRGDTAQYRRQRGRPPGCGQLALPSRITRWPPIRPICWMSRRRTRLAGRASGVGHGGCGWLLLGIIVVRVDDDEHRDDDRQRAQHPGGPQQRPLAGREGAPRRRRCGDRRWSGGRGGRRAPGRSRWPRPVVGAPDGMAAGVARPAGGAGWVAAAGGRPGPRRRRRRTVPRCGSACRGS